MKNNLKEKWDKECEEAMKENKEHPIFKAKWVGEYVHLDEKSRKFFLWLKTDVKVLHIFTEDGKAFCIDLSMKPN